MIEPAAGADRAALAFLVDAYDEEVVAGEPRTVLRLHPRLAPVKVAVLPLVGNDAGARREGARAVRGPAPAMPTEYDDSASIGKRYRRQDEIGTPWALTIDHDTLADGTVTLRDRDTLAQERIPLEGARALLLDRLEQPWQPRRLMRWQELSLESEALRGNPLGDPSVRPLFVWTPPAYDASPSGGSRPSTSCTG